MKNNRDGVLVVGSANMDMVVTTDRFPKPGETVFGNQFGMFPGGKGANQAVCCAKLGGKTYFIGKMGNDIFKEKLIRNMDDTGVLLQGLKVDPASPTGVALITVDSEGENEIVVVSGSNMNLNKNDVLENEALFSSVRVVLSQLEIPPETVQVSAECAAKNDAIFILNPAPAKELSESLLSLVGYLTPNETELSILSGKRVSSLDSIKTAAFSLLDFGVKNVIVTLGEKGALLINRDIIKLFETRKVNTVDTTAAGDAFNGALAFALAKEDNIIKSISFANVVASYSVTKMGAQNSMPGFAEISGLI